MNKTQRSTRNYISVSYPTKQQAQVDIFITLPIKTNRKRRQPIPSLPNDFENKWWCKWVA